MSGTRVVTGGSVFHLTSGGEESPFAGRTGISHRLGPKLGPIPSPVGCTSVTTTPSFVL